MQPSHNTSDKQLSASFGAKTLNRQHVSTIVCSLPRATESSQLPTLCKIKKTLYFCICVLCKLADCKKTLKKIQVLHFGDPFSTYIVAVLWCVVIQPFILLRIALPLQNSDARLKKLQLSLHYAGFSFTAASVSSHDFSSITNEFKQLSD